MNCFKESFILLLVILFVTLPYLASAEIKQFIKEYTYQASEKDSKITARDNALEQVKRMLLEELGSYVESHTEVKNFQMSKDQIVAITAGIVHTKILKEEWDGKNYWVSAEVRADPDEIGKAIEHKRKEITAISINSKQDVSENKNKSTNAAIKLYASKYAMKYHLPSCEWAKKINKRNLVIFKSPEEARKKGYTPCGVCDPDRTGH